jgi:putative peptide zinc metalloprotease protein
MNLAEALNAALPELPTKRAKVGFPQPDPRLIWHENVEDGLPVIAAFIPGSANFFRFTPLQWQLVQLFDGQRSYAEISEIYQRESGVPWNEQDIHDFADALENFWYKSPLEKNIALMQKLSEKRSKQAAKKSKWGDLSSVSFSAWDPDKFMTWTYQRIRWVYTAWFTLVCLGLFAVMGAIFVSHWTEISNDSILYYTFTQKNGWDLLEFWILFCVMGFLHESAHGLTCKHYGGGVHKMGFLLIYMTPAFFVDVTESYVYAGRWQRARVILAGVWTEMFFCALASIVWWGTAPGTYVHELAYKIILVTGIAVIVVNLNPLIRLDGYYLFSEIIGYSDLKEKSTAYLSGLVKKYLWRLPVEVDYVPRQRRWLYLPYAVLSGIYGYLMLFAFVRFANNVIGSYSPAWAFIPAGALALLLFKGRIRTLWRFMQTVFLDKKEWLGSWLRGRRLVAVSIAGLFLLLAPVWPKYVTGRVALEAADRAVIRAMLPGQVQAVYVEEGQPLSAGAPVARLVDLDEQSQLARARTEQDQASANLREAQLTYSNLGLAESRQREARVRSDAAVERAALLNPAAPLSGVVLTPRIHNLVGTNLGEGAIIAEIGDVRRMRARIFVPEFEVSWVRTGAPVHLKLDAFGMPLEAKLISLNPSSTPIDAGLAHEQNYKGIRPPEYYVGEAFLDNPGYLRDGMAGTAKIFVRRESVGQIIWQNIREFVGRKVW